MGGISGWRALAALCAAGGLTLAGSGAALADGSDGTVVVRGTSFPAGVQLAYVGCDDLFNPGLASPQPYIGRGPGRAPAGARSLGYDLDGGSAIGSQVAVDSVIGNNLATIGVFAPQGTTGRAVVGYQPPADQGTSSMWVGVAPVSAPAGSWTTVAATPRAYVWTHYDMSTHAVLEPGSGQAVPVGEFVASRGGDGPGLYALTFGCDGAPFSLDAAQVGRPGAVTTYDLEGLAPTLTIGSSAALVAPGDQVTLRGALSSATAIPHATVALQRREPGLGGWETIRVVHADGSGPVARINPARTALYRWRFADRPLAEGTVSIPVLVGVLAAGEPTQEPTPELPTPDQPTPTPTPTPDQPTPTPTPTPSTPTPTTTPTPVPSLPLPPSPTTPDPTPESPSPAPSDQESAAPSDQPTP